MVKIFTFKKRKDFLRVAKGAYVATHNMVLQAAPSLLETDDIWVGYTATKKIGNAVKRNKSKRRLRLCAPFLHLLLRCCCYSCEYKQGGKCVCVCGGV